MKKIFSVLAAAAAVALSAPASAIVVGGIDFGTLGNTDHLETETLAETLVNGVGDTLSGYGSVTGVNGASSYCAVGSCTLYYYFHDYTVSAFNGTAVQFTGGIVDLYLGTGAPFNFLTQNSVDNVAMITALPEWTRLTGHTFADPAFSGLTGMSGTQTLNGFGTLTGATLSQSGAGQLDSDTSGTFGLAAVAAYFNANSIGDGLGSFADIALTSSSNNFVLNPNDIVDGLAAGCKDGTAAAGAWCLQGTLNTRGATVVPEPATLALVGLALVGMGALRRRTVS